MRLLLLGQLGRGAPVSRINGSYANRFTNKERPMIEILIAVFTGLTALVGYLDYRRRAKQSGIYVTSDVQMEGDGASMICITVYPGDGPVEIVGVRASNAGLKKAVAGIASNGMEVMEGPHDCSSSFVPWEQELPPRRVSSETISLKIWAKPNIPDSSLCISLISRDNVRETRHKIRASARRNSA